jgi:hypothetical protein
MRNRYLYITLLSILGFTPEVNGQPLTQRPRLVVSIHIDQLRNDCLENYEAIFGNDGLRRILSEGLVFTHASFNFIPVDRASATATITTGTTPYYHGITATEWLHRETLRPLSILYDEQYRLSPAQLEVSTLGDELKIATNGKAHVFAFAPTAECAILSAGHTADGAAWIHQGKWTTSTYYQPANEWLDNFRKNHKLGKRQKKSQTATGRETHSPGEDPNMSIARAATSCISGASLGLDDCTDLLSISLTAPPDSSGYVSADRSVAFIIDGIARQIPLERVLFVITGTGNGEEEEERQTAYEHYRIPTGKFYINRTAGLLNMYLGAVYGTAQYVETIHSNQLFLNRKLIDKRNINMSDILSRSQEFLLQLSGVRNVYTSLQLATSDSQILERIRNGFNTDRSGDLIIDIAPGWQLINENTHTTTFSSKGSLSFPIIFFGAGIKAQRIDTPVTTDRIAPTIARCIRIRAPNACMAESLF